MAMPYSLEAEYTKLFNADNDRRTNEIIFAFATDNETPPHGEPAAYIIAEAALTAATTYQKTYIRNRGTAWENFSTRGGSHRSSPTATAGRLFLTDGREEFFTDGIRKPPTRDTARKVD